MAKICRRGLHDLDVTARWSTKGGKPYRTCGECIKLTNAKPSRRAKNRAVHRKLYHKHRKNGNCVHCGQPAPEGHARCDKCAAVNRANRPKWKDIKLAIKADHERYARFLKTTRLRGQRYYRKNRESNHCVMCFKPNEDNPGRVYCARCAEVVRNYSYRRRGKFTERQPEMKARHNRMTLSRVQFEMGDNWPEAKDWVANHIDLFNEPSDVALYLSRPLLPGEDFIDESHDGL